MIVTIIVFILMLALLVLVHEFGHFIAAKKNGVLVEEFGIGFPPRVWGIKWGETLYSINLLPIGGFVKLFGEEYHEDDKNADPKLRNRAFINKKPIQKIVVIVAGIIGNFLLAWVLISFLFTQGVPTPTNNVVVESVQANSPAAVAGIQKNNIITALTAQGATHKLTSSDDLVALSKKYAGNMVIFTITANGKEHNLMITPRKNPPAGQGPLGVVITSFIEKRYTWYQAPFFGLAESFNITYRIVAELSKTLVKFVSFQKTQVDVSGPIGIAQYTGQAIKFGKNAVLELVALLSLNLAVINILPFPALDGGRLMFVLYEWVSKRRVNKIVERNVNIAGMAMLLTLAALITVHDIIKLLK